MIHQSNNPTSKSELIDVWVIEDNAGFRSTLAELINGAPETTCSQQFANGEDALVALTKESPPQVILLDIGLPGMSGVNCIPHIKAISPSTTIIMLTVYEDNENIFRSLCAGASGYLVKRLSGDKIVETIRETHAGGSPMSAQIARKVLNMFAKLVAPHGDYALTSREKEILNHLVAGLSPKMIADKLSLSQHTIITHTKNIYAKLQVHSRSEAVAKALKEGLL